MQRTLRPQRNQFYCLKNTDVVSPRHLKNEAQRMCELCCCGGLEVCDFCNKIKHRSLSILLTPPHTCLMSVITSHRGAGGFSIKVKRKDENPFSDFRSRLPGSPHFFYSEKNMKWCFQIVCLKVPYCPDFISIIMSSMKRFILLAHKGNLTIFLAFIYSCIKKDFLWSMNKKLGWTTSLY